MGKKVGLVALILAVLLIAAVTKSFLKFKEQEEKADLFAPHIRSYMDVQVTESKTEPYIRGKVVTVDVLNAAVDSFTFPKLPDDLRATAPEDVGTVALIEWGKEKVGVYKDTETGQITGDAFRSFANVTLIDWEGKTVIDKKLFYGEDPVSGKSSDGSFTSQWPMFDVVAYLQRLPRK